MKPIFKVVATKHVWDFYNNKTYEYFGEIKYTGSKSFLCHLHIIQNPQLK